MRRLITRAIRFSIRTVVLLALVAIMAFLAFRLMASQRERGDAAALAPANGKFVATRLGTMHVSTWGDVAVGKPVIMTHGMAAWGGLWEETGRALAAKGYYVVAVDVPPFGFSGRTNTDYSRAAGARRVVETVAALGLRAPVLVGHSYGGGVALEAALQSPRSFGGLVLVCPVTGLINPAPPSAQPAPVPLLLRSEFLAEMLVSATVTNPWLTSFLVKRFMHRKDRLTDRHIEILHQPLARAGNTAGMTSWLRQFSAGVGDAEALSTQPREAEKLALPLVLLWGDQDTIVTVPEGQQLQRLLKAVDLTVLPDVGHMPQLEDPAGFNASLLAALARVERQ